MKLLILLPTVALLSTGCSLVRKAPGSVTTTSLGTPTRFHYADAKRNTSEHYLAEYAKASSPDDKKRLRNMVIDEMSGLIDDEFDSFCQNLRTDRVIKNVFTKIASLALTGIAPFSSGDVAKVLAGIDTGLKGTSEAVDVEAFGSRAPEILINIMRSERAKVEERITLMKEKSSDAYTLEASFRDLARYRNAGFLATAFSALADQASKAAATSEKNASDAKLDPGEATRKALQAR